VFESDCPGKTGGNKIKRARIGLRGEEGKAKGISGYEGGGGGIVKNLLLWGGRGSIRGVRPNPLRKKRRGEGGKERGTGDKKQVGKKRNVYPNGVLEECVAQRI